MAITAPNTMFTRTLAPTSALGALQHDLELILDGATKASSFTAVAVETSVTTAPSTTAGTSGIRSTENFPMLRFKFGLRDAEGTDGKTGNYKVVLYTRAATVVDGADAVPLVPEVVATGVITAGSMIYADDIGSATATYGDMWADTITLTSNAIGVAKHSPADNTPATLMVDTRGACAYQVFVYLGSSTDAIDVWCQRSGALNALPLLDGFARTMTPVITVISIEADAALSGKLTLNAATKRITLRPHATGIYMDDGTASANSDPLGLNTVEMMGPSALLGALRFYAAVATNMTVIEEG